MLRSYGLSKNGIFSYGIVGFSFLDSGSYLANTTGFLFYALTSNIINGKLYNTIIGRESEYITVTGPEGSETYQCPDIQDYRDADLDNFWFNLEGYRRTVTKQDLVCWDISRTPVNYDDDNPNVIRAIGIFNILTTLTIPQRDELFSSFRLPIFWDDSLNDYGHLKNKDMISGGLGIGWGYNGWIPTVGAKPLVTLAVINNADPTKVVITTDIALNESLIPAGSAFTITGKTVSNVAISGSIITLTVSVAFTGGVDVYVDYTKPAINPILSTGGFTMESFTAQRVFNDVIPAILTDGNTKFGFDWEDSAKFTPSVYGEVDVIADSFGGSAFTITPIGGVGYKPIRSANGIAFTEKASRTSDWTLVAPHTMYFLIKHVGRYNLGTFFHGKTHANGNLLVVERSAPDTIGANILGGSASPEKQLPIGVYSVLNIGHFSGGGIAVNDSAYTGWALNGLETNCNQITIGYRNDGISYPTSFDLKIYIQRTISDTTGNRTLINTYLKNRGRL